MGLAYHLHFDVPPVRVPLPVLRLARVRAGVFLPLGLLHHQSAVSVDPLAAIHRQHLALALPGDGLDGVPRHGTLDHQAAPGHAGDFRHLSYVRQAVHVHPGGRRTVLSGVSKCENTCRAVNRLKIFTFLFFNL
jgi:hypothetical protein